MDGARIARGIWCFSELVGCGHVFDLFVVSKMRFNTMRPQWPLAMM